MGSLVLASGLSAVGDRHPSNKEVVMAVMIGIDPHKRSHAAVALGTDHM